MAELKVHASTAIIERMVHSDDSRAEFSARLKKALEYAGQSGRGEGARLARLARVTPKAASKWLNGEARPGHDKLMLIANALRVREEWLDYGKGPMTSSESAAELPEGVSPMPNRRVDDMVLHDTEIVEDDGPLRPDEVELPCFREVEFSAGDGRTQVIENHGNSVRFSLPRLARAGVQPQNGACATASGSSMEPTIADGSPIAIDKGCRHVIDGKIYALDHGGMLRVKRLYKLPLGKVRLVSDNADEYPEEICSLMGEDAPRIIGRVFWWEVFD
ncbi:helix-turn-helix transcriptional regulator [Halomonas sp. LR5S20]|uniref:Helix-turn-helix transcriptional regulator n=3 Tax=Halomonas TaxID=2745 RepID=A0ABT6UXF3_9GAMM|nr:helix-turn-helix transcriptional regulator [Halomonas rhizosphaerae]